jgi:hypothetical protein
MVDAAGHNREDDLMRTPALVPATVVVALLAVGFGSSTLTAKTNGAEATPAAPIETTVAVKDFAVLKGVKAVPMTSKELKAVKGLHVHFVSPSNTTQWGLEGLQLAGDVKTENNWSNEWGGSDGIPVAPSYKGLCVATGLSGSGNGVIFIPGGQFQCPL